MSYVRVCLTHILHNRVVSGSGLVEVVRFPWRRPHHSMVDTEQRRVLLEAYLSMLFTHNAALQTHPRTVQFLTRTDAADPSMVGAVVLFDAHVVYENLALSLHTITLHTITH